MGTGTGRIIKLVLNTLSDVRILGTESNQRMFNFVSKRFSGVSGVSIRGVDASEFLNREENYDMTICMMNTFGNISETFKKVVDHSKIFVFSLYNQEFDSQRKKMYEARGHSDFKISEGKCRFNDPWVKGFVSKSYTSEEIEKLVSDGGGEIISLEKVGILYFVVAKKV